MFSVLKWSPSYAQRKPDRDQDEAHAQRRPDLVLGVLHANAKPEHCLEVHTEALRPDLEGQLRHFHHAMPDLEGQLRRIHHAAPNHEGQLRHIHHAVPDCQVDSHDDAQRHPDRWVWINPYSQNQYSSIQTVARLEEQLLYPELLNFTFQPHLFRLTCSKRTVFLPHRFPGYISILHLRL